MRVRTLTACTNGSETGAVFIDKQAPGNSDFNYDPTTFTWQFNWQTKPFVLGCYNIYIEPDECSGCLCEQTGR